MKTSYPLLTISKKTIDSVIELSDVKFGVSYLNTLEENKDATLIANLLGWTEQKSEKDTLRTLVAMQKAHFIEGNPLTNSEDVSAILSNLKLSPPNKSLKNNKLIKDAQFILQDIEEIQEIINTRAIPALLLAHNDNLVLLNHNLYLSTPNAIVEAITQEIG